MGTYKKLFTLEIFHSYFSNGYCMDLEVFETEGNLKLYSSYDFIFKRNPEGFQVLYNNSRLDKIFKNNTAKKEELYFYYTVCTKDYDYFNYTEDSEYYLYENKEGSCSLSPSQCEKPALKNGAKPVFDISLKIDLTKEEPKAEKFKIELKNRKTFWKYIISCCEKDRDFSIKDIDGKKEFLKNEFRFDFSRAKSIYSFQSSEKIDLKEYPDLKLQLKDNKSKKTIGKFLAVPDSSRIYNEVVSDCNEAFSYIFVNL